jgi:hypothetical protein
MDIINRFFSLSDTQAYQVWREKKLINHTNNLSTLMVMINNIAHPSCNERDDLLSIVRQHNFAFYRFNTPDKNTSKNKQKLPQLGATLGLKQLDGNLCADDDQYSAITVTQHKNQHQYIPYSNKRLSWHTDGYYNTPEQQINSFILHCEHPAKSGGESLVLDHEIAYILLRDENPDYIHALMQSDAMTIPANILNGQTIRAAQSGSVFSLHPTGGLHMRYSARKRNIEWKKNSATLEAVSFLENLWENGSPYILRYALKAHEGIICNNVLHCRTAFEDSNDSQKKRLLYRGRYIDRISNSC